MKQKNLIILILSLTLIIMCAFISSSYAYYTISASKTVEMQTTTSIPSCVGLTISDSKAFTLPHDYAVPITDDQFFNSSSNTQSNFKYSFSVKNDCTETKSLSIGIVPLNSSSFPIDKLRFLLVETTTSQTLNKNNVKTLSSNSKSLSTDIQNYLNKKYQKSATTVYNIGTASITNKATKNYDLYVWVSKDASTESMDKTFSATVVLYS